MTLHIFPMERRLQLEWSCLLKIGKPVTKYMHVCSLHFIAADYHTCYNVPGISKTRKYLRKGVLPSQKLPIASHPRREPAPLTKELRAERAGRRHFKNLGNSCEYEPKAGETGEEPDNRVAAPEDRRDDELATAEALLELHGKTPLNQELDPIMKVDKAVQFDENLFKARKYNSVLELIRNDKDLNTLTGMPHMAALDALVRCVEKIEIERFSMPLKERIMLTMMKLKLDLSFRTLSVFFQCSATTSQNYFHDVIRKLSRVLSVLIRWPDKEEIMRNMPQCFNKYKKTRVVLDCTEVQTEKTNCLKCRISTYSHYKGRNTVKFLIGVAPSGLITYVSRGFGGRFSEKSIFNLSGLLEKLDPHNDAIMVDKGFLIANECFESSIPLIMPPFLRKKKQFSQEEVELTVSIAAARVHVEPTIQRVKIFAILTNNLDTSFLVPYIDEIAIVICAIVNMSPPILAIDKY